MMSDLSAQNLTALGATVMPTVLPPDVRKAGAKGEQLYQAALGFEQMLTQQLTNQLAATMQGTDGSDGSTGSDQSSDDPSSQSIFPSDSSSSSMVSQMLPQALSDSITQAGGLGIAHQLYLMLAQSTGLQAATGSAGSGSAASGAASGDRIGRRTVKGLVEHLERQLESNRRLLQIVLAQGEAIKVQDVQTVLARLADVQHEMAQARADRARARRAAPHGGSSSARPCRSGHPGHAPDADSRAHRYTRACALRRAQGPAG